MHLKVFPSCLPQNSTLISPACKGVVPHKSTHCGHGTTIYRSFREGSLIPAWISPCILQSTSFPLLWRPLHSGSTYARDLSKISYTISNLRILHVPKTRFCSLFLFYLLLYLLRNIYIILICCFQRRDNT